MTNINDWTTFAMMLRDRAFAKCDISIDVSEKMAGLVLKKFKDIDRSEVVLFIEGYMGLPYRSL